MTRAHLGRTETRSWQSLIAALGLTVLLHMPTLPEGGQNKMIRARFRISAGSFGLFVFLLAMFLSLPMLAAAASFTIGRSLVRPRFPSNLVAARAQRNELLPGVRRQGSPKSLDCRCSQI